MGIESTSDRRKFPMCATSRMASNNVWLLRERATPPRVVFCGVSIRRPGIAETRQIEQASVPTGAAMV
jgi:hypothetical protein